MLVTVDEEHPLELEPINSESLLEDIVFGLLAVGQLLDDAGHQLYLLSAAQLRVEVVGLEGFLQEGQTHQVRYHQVKVAFAALRQ